MLATRTVRVAAMVDWIAARNASVSTGKGGKDDAAVR
jgi:hypothetical protein